MVNKRIQTMNKKTLLKILIIFCLVITFSVTVCACAPENDLLFAENNVIGRFADGMEVLKDVPTPIDATQFLTNERVEKKFYIDNRVEGLHLSGLYLASGEKLIVTVSESVAQKNHSIVINANTPNEEVFALSSVTTEIVSANGGIIDIYIDSNDKELNSFEIVISGGVPSPYYRYGIDKFEGDETKLQNYSDNNDFIAVLDCANIRFYIPNHKIKETKKLFETLSWWRNSIELVNEINGLSFANGYNRPLLVYFGEGTDSDNVIFASLELIDDAISYNNLLKGDAQTLLEKITFQKAKQKQSFADDEMCRLYSKVVSLVTNISFADNKKMTNGVLKNFASGLDNLDYSLKNSLSVEEKVKSFFSDLLHSFGIENTKKLLEVSYETPIMSNEIAIDNLAKKCADILKIDVRELLNIYEINVSNNLTRTLDRLLAEQKIKKYVPVYTNFTVGQFENKNQLGNIVPFGRATRFDFKSGIVSPQSNWNVIGLSGSEGAWKNIESGVYEYNPIFSKLEDYFVITLKNGENEVQLHGKISVDIRTSKFEIFENVAFREVDAGVKQYKKLPVSQQTSLDGAIIPKTRVEEEVNDYCFYVTNGTFQVNETAKYTLFLKSSGLCRVDFGVPKSMNKLFYNILTVNEYTKELSAEITLQKDVIYHFVIYDLSIQGGAWARLGIAKGDQAPHDIPKSMLMYNGFDKDDVFEYKEPQIKIDGFDKTTPINLDYDNKDFEIVEVANVNESDAKENLLDKNLESGIGSVGENSKYEVVILNNKKHSFNNLQLDLGEVVFATGKEVYCTVWVSNDGEKYRSLNKINLVKGKNIYQVFANPDNSFIKLVFSSSKSFVLDLKEIAFSRKLVETTIIPNTSSKIEYRGLWKREHKYLSLNGSVNQSNEKNCAASFNFYGDAFAVFATKGNGFGLAVVEVDGEKYTVDLSNETIVCNSMIFSITFDTPGRHSIKIMPKDRDIINIDYVSYVQHTEPPRTPINNAKLVFIIVIPSIVLCGTIIFLFVDIVARARKRKQKFAGIIDFDDNEEMLLNKCDKAKNGKSNAKSSKKGSIEKAVVDNAILKIEDNKDATSDILKSSKKGSIEKAVVDNATLKIEDNKEATSDILKSSKKRNNKKS